MITESEFIAATDRTLAAVGTALDAALAESDADLDWNLVDGILEIDCGSGGKLIVNRHVPNREIWVAARSGGPDAFGSTLRGAALKRQVSWKNRAATARNTATRNDRYAGYDK